MDRPRLSTPLWRRSFFTQALCVVYMCSERGGLLIIASGKHYIEYPSSFSPSIHHSIHLLSLHVAFPSPLCASPPPPLALTRHHSLLHPSQAWSLSHVTTSIHLPHPHYHNLLSTRPGPLSPRLPTPSFTSTSPAAACTHTSPATFSRTHTRAPLKLYNGCILTRLLTSAGQDSSASCSFSPPHPRPRACPTNMPELSVSPPATVCPRHAPPVNCIT